ncbi:MAG: hypothetical protein Greene041619_776 [Candidatus Peregrinibacteria bacterium Greene0416_19]|nr:MAG: hypothetical protein Greene041619_776 [Candidatus Peregrinibacteria bacterium Greene0416_19]
MMHNIRIQNMIDLPFMQRDRAVQYILDHKKELIERFANDVICPSETTENPISIFMAGAPGAGKTEFSKSLIADTGIRVVRIDADEIRTFFPWYDGENSDEVQKGAFRGVDKLHDYVLQKKKNVIIDSTFTPYQQVDKNIRRSLAAKRLIKVYYLYQDPILSWEFTKIRAVEEGRSVPKDMFIDALFESRENISKVKDVFGSDISLVMVKKDYTTDQAGAIKLSINEVDEGLVIPYNREQLNELLT